MKRRAHLPELVYGLLSLLLIVLSLAAGGGLLFLGGRAYIAYLNTRQSAEKTDEISPLTEKIAKDSGAALYYDHMARGAAFMDRKDYAHAKADYERAIALAPRRSNAYRALLRLANAQIALFENDAALTTLTAAIERGASNDPTPRARRGTLYRTLHKLDESRRDFDAAIALEPQDYGFRLSRLEVEMEAKLTREAARDAGRIWQMTWSEDEEKRLRQEASDAATHLDFKTAIGKQTAILKLRPDNADDHLRRSDYFLWSGQSDKALADIEAAETLNPYSTRARWYRATAYDFTLAPEKALPELDGVLARDPENDEMNRSRGLARFKLGRYKDAVGDFANAFALNADGYSAIWLHLARLYQGQPNPRELRNGLAAFAARYRGDEHPDAPLPWPEPVLRFFLGEISETTLLTKAEESEQDATRRDQLCEARFYAGMIARAQNREAHGVALLRIAVDKCHPGFIESIAARWALQRPAR